MGGAELPYLSTEAWRAVGYLGLPLARKYSATAFCGSIQASLKEHGGQIEGLGNLLGSSLQVPQTAPPQQIRADKDN